MIRRALAAVVTIALLAGCDGGTDEPKAEPGTSTSATTSPSDSSSPIDPGPVVECPKGIVEIDPALPDAVPEGATSVRLCEAAAGQVTPPLDALTTDVTGIVQAVNGQRLVTRGCADQLLPTFQLAFGYPDGARFVVAGRFTECGELLVGSARRARAKPVLDRFTRVLGTQRDSSTPPADAAVDVADLDCAQPAERHTWPLVDPRTLSVAVLCVGEVDHPERARRSPIDADELAVLVRSMRSDTTSTAGMFCPYQPSGHWIVGANAWGDPITMEVACVGLGIHGYQVWVPRGRARSIVNDLVADAHR